ncbi:MAG: hypothetical protein MK137_07315 [Rickettsiales bacterium]|nr:hypothetical protein [Rickettsiales bacterium]
MPHSDTFKQKAQRCKETSLSRALTNSERENLGVVVDVALNTNLFKK